MVGWRARDEAVTMARAVGNMQEVQTSTAPRCFNKLDVRLNCSKSDSGKKVNSEYLHSREDERVAAKHFKRACARVRMRVSVSVSIYGERNTGRARGRFRTQ